ncbi:hypothetical protein I350_07373 [Cryptococcus amylolentus CBS 6273]|uniref:Uncharacterized protein n=1 Tax=Cryptococcus amylolentus CBS 6273 TaxID=1296118 RepID=A0A1E3JEE1_9TREE|nr:hypothetical protein I350_07373 [Cryptococcus amylolentus CBS 6273]
MGFVDRWDKTQALVSARLSKPVRPFLALHLISSSTIFILSILSLETNASTSHFLRHLIDSADLSSVIFVDELGNIGDWRIAPARVVNITDVQEGGSSNSLVCNDQGTKCKVVEGKTMKVASKQKAEAESDSSSGSGSESETEFGNSTSTGTANESQSTSTITTVSTLQGNAITTRLLAVPTVVTSSGQVVTTTILMDEAGATLADIESSSLSTGNVPTSTSVASSAVTVRTSSSLTASSTSTTALSTSASLVATSTTSASQVVSSVATSSSSVTSNASSLAPASPSTQEWTESASSSSSASGESSSSSGDEVHAARHNALSRPPPPPKFYRRRRVEKKSKSNGEDSSDDEQTDSIPSRRDSAKHRSHKRLYFAGARSELSNTTGSTASITGFIATTTTSSKASAVATASTSADCDSDSGVDSTVLPKGMTVAQLKKLLEEQPDQFEGIAMSPERLAASVPIKSSLDGVKPVQGEDGTIIGANITGVGGDADTFVSQQCAAGFAWSVNSLDNFVREEIVLACFFMWVLGLAVVAVLNESIPHLMALLFSLVLTIAWSANDLRLSFAFWRHFSEMVRDNCGDNVSFFPDYLAKRVGFQGAALGINVLTLGLSGWGCWKLRDSFGWQTFQRIGASSTMNKMYKLVLGLSIILQLDAFALVTFFALYLDQITRGQASYFMSNCKAWRALYSILVIMLFPWLYFGWKSIRTESRRQFMVFIGLSIFFLAGWATSFASSTFRTTFTHWSFFKALGILALILTVATLVLAVLRRMTFGRGLSEYLKIGDDVGKWRSLVGGGGGLGEKETEVRVDDAGSEGRKEALPTFSTIFGPGPAPPPRRMFSNTQGVQAIRQWQTESSRASSAPSWAAGDDQRRDL